MSKNKGLSTQKITLIAMLAVLVVLLQVFTLWTQTFLPFAVTFSLIAIVLGAALYGPTVGGGLGLVFAGIVLLTNSEAFWAVSPLGTLVTVIAKGVLCGIVAGLVFKAFRRFKNPYLAIGAASVSCPIVNTGVFVLGCRAFFLPTITEWAVEAGFDNAISYIFLGIVGINFLIEMATVVIICPLILRLLKIKTEKLY